MPNLDNAYWTLVIEMLFYILMIVLIIIKQLKRIEMVGCIGLLIVGIYSFLLNVRFPFLFETISHFFPLIKYFPLFFAGILFYKLKNKSYQINRYVMYIVILVCLCLQISLYGKGIVDEYSVSFQEYAVMIGIYFFLFFLFVNKMLAFIVSPVTLFLGSISYALYLIHQIVSLHIILPFFTTSCGWTYWPSALLTAVIAIILASLVTFYIEKPAGRKMKAWLTKTFYTNSLD